MTSDRNLLEGIIFSILSSVLFSVTAIFVSIAGDDCNAYFISTVRFIIGIVLTLLFLRVSGAPMYISDRRSWIMRGITGSISMVTYYLSVTYSGSGKGTLLANTYPAFAALFAPLFFSIKSRKSDWVSIALCIAGTYVVFGGSGKESVFGDAMGVISAVAAGFSIHYIKRSAGSERAEVIYLSACLFGLVVAPFAFSGKIHITGKAMTFIVLAALTAFFGQYYMNLSYKHLSAVKGSILSFLKIPLTIVLSIFIGEVFDLKFAFGTALIFSGLIFTALPYAMRRIRS